ncbi:unnamed protein product [Auanema sp. JU1783]|nr:unnamed protein product [Auanema sp. JU1783]
MAGRYNTHEARTIYGNFLNLKKLVLEKKFSMDGETIEVLRQALFSYVGQIDELLYHHEVRGAPKADEPSVNEDSSLHDLFKRLESTSGALRTAPQHHATTL